MSDSASPDPLLSPYASPFGDAQVVAVPADASLQPVRPPRVWTVVVVFLTAIGCSVSSQVVFALGLLALLVNEGMTVPEAANAMIDKITDPPMFLAAGALSQLMLGTCAIVPALMSPEGFQQRLGLVAPGVGPGKFSLLVLSSLFPTAVGLALAHLVVQFIPPDQTVAKLYAKLTLAWAVPFVLFIALAPGFFEEMLFRGYIQRRLEKRFGPGIAIGIAATLFAVVHISPQVVVFAFPIGIWFGIIAWRTGSIWPTIAGHAFINGMWNIFNLSQKFDVIPEVSTTGTLVGMAILGLGCFVPSCWILRTFDQRAAHGAPGSPEPGAE